MKRAATAIRAVDLDAQRSLPEELEATSRTVRAAHEAYVQGAIGSVRWERRGVLRRLTRVERREDVR